MEYFLNEPIYQELMEMLQAKQDAPESEGSAGQVLALALVSGELVPVWITPASVTVQDVQIDGSSIVQDGVANVPLASITDIGCMKVNPNRGMRIDSSGFLRIDGANSLLIKAGTDYDRPITPEKQHESAFYGIAKASGDTTQSASSNAVGVYTETALQYQVLLT